MQLRRRDGVRLMSILAPARSTVLGVLALGALATLATVACTQRARLHQHEVAGPIMGTAFVVKVVLGSDEAKPARLQAIDETVRATLDEVDRLMSTYKPESEISRFNRAEPNVPIAISAPTVDVLRFSVALSNETSGAFDPSVGPLVEAWGFGTRPAPEQLPDDELIKQLRARTGLDKIIIDSRTATTSHAAGSLTKTTAGVELDLSAVAKGYAADRVGTALETLGFNRYMVEIGGEIRVSGHNQGGEPWRLAIERPPGRDSGSGSAAGPRYLSAQAVVALERGGLATSGDYRNYYERDGERFSHSIDPATGRPVTHTGASVSVIAETCAEADALATALLVMGPERGLEFAAARGHAALFLAYNGQGGLDESMSPSMLRLLEASQPSNLSR